METFFAHKDAYPVIAMLGVGLCVTMPFLAHYWYKARRAELLLSLKHAMVERGMNASEICAVIEAGDKGSAEVHESGHSVGCAKVQV